jgi:UDP-glucose 4-epimerase
METVVGSKVERSFAPPRPGDIQHSLADISNAWKYFGYKAKTDLKTGLAQLND